MISILHCYGIGYRCNTDNLMKSLNIRKYSGPFSWMITDLKTSMNFIDTEFNDFTNIVSKKKHNFKWNNKYWDNNVYFNHKFVPINDNVNVSDMKNICCWNHHNMEDPNIINTIHRRSKRLLESIKSKQNTLLIYIDNIQTYTSNKLYEYYDYFLCYNFIKDKENIYLCLLVPLLNFPIPPMLYKPHKRINVIFYKSNMEGGINDFINTNIRWDLIKNIILENYKFNIIQLNSPKPIQTKINNSIQHSNMVNSQKSNINNPIQHSNIVNSQKSNINNSIQHINMVNSQKPNQININNPNNNILKKCNIQINQRYRYLRK